MTPMVVLVSLASLAFYSELSQRFHLQVLLAGRSTG